jgi:hypothetical protein
MGPCVIPRPVPRLGPGINAFPTAEESDRAVEAIIRHLKESRTFRKLDADESGRGLEPQMVRAKFHVTNVTLYAEPKGAGSVTLAPVYKYQQGISGNACEENRQFWEATPSGQITMSITNPSGFAPFVEAFHRSKPFYVDFTEASE